MPGTSASVVGELGSARGASAPHADVVLPHAVQSVGEARRLLGDDLRTRGVRTPVVDDALIVVSELVANSLRHAAPTGDGGLHVGWDLLPDVLVLRVTDGGGHSRPVETASSPAATSGRGLSIVRQLTSDWGVSEAGRGITVHAVLPLGS